MLVVSVESADRYGLEIVNKKLYVYDTTNKRSYEVTIADLVEYTKYINIIGGLYTKNEAGINALLDMNTEEVGILKVAYKKKYDIVVKDKLEYIYGCCYDAKATQEFKINIKKSTFLHIVALNNLILQATGRPDMVLITGSETLLKTANFTFKDLNGKDIILNILNAVSNVKAKWVDVTLGKLSCNYKGQAIIHNSNISSLSWCNYNGHIKGTITNTKGINWSFDVSDLDLELKGCEVEIVKVDCTKKVQENKVRVVKSKLKKLFVIPSDNLNVEISESEIDTLHISLIDIGNIANIDVSCAKEIKLLFVSTSIEKVLNSTDLIKILNIIKGKPVKVSTLITHKDKQRVEELLNKHLGKNGYQIV